MANVSITNLPAAQPLTGTELVPVVQDGLTVRTTTAAIAASPSLTQTFLTVNNEPTLPNSRYFSTDGNLALSDGGAQSYYRISLTGAAASLNTAGNGVLVKSGTSILNRTLSTSGSGLSVANGDGISGNPTFSLTGNVQSLANASGTGMLVLAGPSALTFRSIIGTASEIDVLDGDGVLGNPTIGLADNPTLPGTGATIVPKGTSAQQPAGVQGQFRYNTDTGAFEGYTSSGWGTFSTAGGVTTFSAGTTGLSPSAPTTGAIVLTGTLNVANGGTGATTAAGARTNLSVPSTTGSGASGTWGIDISGNAATATTSTNVSGGAANRIVFNTASGSTSFIVAPSSANTYLEWSGSNFQWSTNPLGTVTSVGLALPAEFTISGSPVTTSGTLTGAWATQTGNYFFAAPNGSPGVPSFRAIVAADIPTLNQNTTGQAGSVANSVTFTNTGGASPGTTFDGSAARTIDYSTVGAPKADGTGATGTWGINISGNAATSTSSTTATNLAGGAAGSIPYQTGAGTTTFLAAGSGVLVGGTTPSYSTAPSLTGTNFSSIPNGALQNSSVTIGTTSISLGGTSLTLGGLTSVAVTQNPTTALQVATKQYVDGLVSSGITYHTPVKYEVPNTTGNLNATYNQPGGPGVGVGATLTNAGTLAAFAPDGPTASPGDRILIYNQTNQFENGVYTVTTVGDGSTPWVLTRATDADTYALKSTTGLGEGDAFFITSGNTGAGETYVCNTSGTITFGTTAITFVQVSSSQVYSAGTGLTLTGTQFSLTSPVVTTLGGTGLTTYTAGDLPYYAAGTALSKLGIGAASTILTSSGTAPQWTTPSSISVGTATNVAGGSANRIVYNTAAGTTNFIVAPTIANTFLEWSGSAFQWSTNPLGTVTSVDVSGGTTGLTFSGGPITTSGTITMAGTLAIANGGTNGTATPTAGAIAYGTGTAYAFTSAGSAGQVLTSGGAGVPTWTTATSANTASAIVQRDASGNFSAGTITATLSGNASTATTATNATNTTITANSTNATNYLTFVSATSGNLGQLVNSSITCNPSTGAITGGISGGTF